NELTTAKAAHGDDQLISPPKQPLSLKRLILRQLLNIITCLMNKEKKTFSFLLEVDY
ncbi:hypothetical protein LCGC14_1258220, partial [marine sediment metagenome]